MTKYFSDGEYRYIYEEFGDQLGVESVADSLDVCSVKFDDLSETELSIFNFLKSMYNTN